MTLKEQILELKSKNIKQILIAEKLNCTTGTVSYHCNPDVKRKALEKKKHRSKNNQDKRKLELLELKKEKEIFINLQKVSWKHAEAICNSKLIELGYETNL